MAASSLPPKFRSKLPTLHGGAQPQSSSTVALRDEHAELWLDAVPEPTPSSELIAEITLIPERSSDVELSYPLPASREALRTLTGLETANDEAANDEVASDEVASLEDAYLDEDIPPSPPSIENFLPLWEQALSGPESAPLLRMVDTFSDDEFDPEALSKPKPPSRRQVLAAERASQRSQAPPAPVSSHVGTTTQEDLPPVTSIAPVAMSAEEVAPPQPARSWLGYAFAAAVVVLVAATGISLSEGTLNARAVDVMSASAASYGSAVELDAHATLASAAAESKPKAPAKTDSQPAARVLPRTAELRVRGAGCELWIDGSNHGKRDVVVLKIVPGIHSVGCRRDGVVKSVRVNAAANQTSIAAF